MITAKFVVQSIEGDSDAGSTVKVKMQAYYDKSGIPEDEQFAEVTPSGSLEMVVTNEAALAQLEVGKLYYIDIYPTYLAYFRRGGHAKPAEAEAETQQEPKPPAAEPAAEAPAAEPDARTPTDPPVGDGA